MNLLISDHGILYVLNIISEVFMLFSYSKIQPANVYTSYPLFC
jgi:hypothetical protein